MKTNKKPTLAFLNSIEDVTKYLQYTGDKFDLVTFVDMSKEELQEVAKRQFMSESDIQTHQKHNLRILTDFSLTHRESKRRRKSKPSPLMNETLGLTTTY